MPTIRKPKPKPRYSAGMNLAMRHAVEPYEHFYAGAIVSVLEVRPATFDVRYRVESAQKQTGWISEADLALPFEGA